jgi:hypothetical protein
MWLCPSIPKIPPIFIVSAGWSNQGKERLAADLSTVLKLATHIGGIRDEGGLQWQLLGMLFDIVPAQRGAILFFDSAGEIASSAAWDRVHRPQVPVRVSRTLLKKIIANELACYWTTSDEAPWDTQPASNLPE